MVHVMPMASIADDSKSSLLGDNISDDGTSSCGSYGWEEVSALKDDESVDGLDAENSEEVIKKEEVNEYPAVYCTNQGIDRTMNTSKAHELSESENSSEEHVSSSPTKHTVISRMSLNVNGSINSGFKTEKHSSDDSNDSNCDSEMDTNISNSLGIKERNLQMHSHNKLLDETEQLSVENIDVGEVWLVQCPLGLDPKELVNKELDFAGISEFIVETQNTEKMYTAIACTGRWKSLSCLLPSMERKQLEAVVVNAAGQIVITEEIMNSQPSSAVSAESNNPKFPENLKVRHPLFGADYEKELGIRKQRLLISSTEKKKKRKKKKEMPDDISYGTVNEDQAIDRIPSFSEDIEIKMEFPVTSKKAKKRRHSESFISNSDHSNKDDLSELKESRNPKKRLRQSISNSVDNSMEIDSFQEQHSKKKKKKKKSDTP